MEYRIEGTPLPVVICELQAGETMITERGSMSWMSPNMKMETSSGGGIGKALSRMFAGESLFLNRYTAQGGPGMIAFAASFPGNIRPFHIRPGRELILQKISGNGIVFAEFDGHVVEYDLLPGESMVVDTGYLAAMDASCSMDIRTVPGAKNMFFGGEGLFHTVVTGPGRIYLQTMPIQAVAGAILPYIPTKSD